MPVLIDGFNLLHAARSHLSGPDDLGRAQLSKLLGSWSAAAREKVTIVWDGAAPPGNLAEQLSDPGVVAIYAGGETADNRIARLLAADSAARRVMVVSDDREVHRSARRHGATPTGCKAFLDSVTGELRRAARDRTGDKELPEKRSGLEGKASEEWLRLFGFDPEAPPPFEHP